MFKYKIALIDSDECEISIREEDTIAESKAVARYLASNMFARSCETTHENLGSVKVNVIENKSGQIVFDLFVKN